MSTLVFFVFLSFKNQTDISFFYQNDDVLKKLLK